MPQSNQNFEVLVEVVRVKLDGLTELVKSGFERQDRQFDRVADDIQRIDRELISLKEWKAARDAEDEAAAKVPVVVPEERDWVKIVIAALAIVGTALTIVLQVIGQSGGV